MMATQRAITATRGIGPVPTFTGVRGRGRLQVAYYKQGDREADRDLAQEAQDALRGLRKEIYTGDKPGGLPTDNQTTHQSTKIEDLKAYGQQGLKDLKGRGEQGLKDLTGRGKDLTDRGEQGLQNLTDRLPASTQGLKEFVKTAGAKPEYDEGEPKENRFFTAYTRRREIFAGRFAMVGISAALFWEWYFPSHPNILSQITTGFNLAGLPVDNKFTAMALGTLVAWNVISAAAPWSKTWDPENRRDVSKRPRGPPGDFSDLTHPTEFLGISKGWGFTKRNELFNGRMAMLGFAAALIGQWLQGGLYGPGPLAQIANYLHVTPDSVYSSWPTVAIGFFILSTTVSYLLGNPGVLRGEEEIY